MELFARIYSEFGRTIRQPSHNPLFTLATAYPFFALRRDSYVDTLAVGINGNSFSLSVCNLLI